MADRASIIDDMSNPLVKRRVMAQIGGLQGLWRIEVCRYRPRRSDRQNRYYWPCFVAPFAAYLVEQGNEFSDPEDAAHEILKAQFLRTHVIDKTTGQRLPWVGSSAALTTEAFNEYLDKCAAMLAQECGIVVPDPSVYREQNEHQHRATGAGKVTNA